MGWHFLVTLLSVSLWGLSSRRWGCLLIMMRVGSPSMMWKPGFISTLLLAAPSVGLSIQSSVHVFMMEVKTLPPWSSHLSIKQTRASFVVNFILKSNSSFPNESLYSVSSERSNNNNNELYLYNTPVLFSWPMTMTKWFRQRTFFSWLKRDGDELNIALWWRQYDETYVFFSLTRRDETKMWVLTIKMDVKCILPIGPI